MRKHLVIPDTQVTPETPNDHLGWIGKYIVEKKPDVIVHLGDFNDLNSLSSYNTKIEFEGKRYKKDIQAGIRANAILWQPLEDYNETRRRFKEKQYKPERHLCLGNHENRITRLVQDDPRLEGIVGLDDLGYEQFGWTVHNFLDVVEIGGIHYSHYFYNPLSGRPYGGQSIDTRLKNLGFSFVQGHQQQYMVGSRQLNNGRRIRGLVSGSGYLHDEEYRGPQANGENRMIFMLHEVLDGDYMLMEISFEYLCRKYEQMSLHQFMKEKYPEIFFKSNWLQRQERVARAA